MNVGLHHCVQRSLILYVFLMPWPDRLPGPKHYYRFETYDFVALYSNSPDAELQDVMLKLLESTLKHQSQHGLRLIELHWGCANEHTSPIPREASWSSKQPQPTTANSKNPVRVGPDC